MVSPPTYLARSHVYRYIAIFTTLNAGNSGFWSPLTSISVLLNIGYADGQFLVSQDDSLAGPVWTEGQGRSLTFWMSFEEPVGALSNGATVATLTPTLMVKPGQTRAFKLPVRGGQISTTQL